MSRKRRIGSALMLIAIIIAGVSGYSALRGEKITGEGELPTPTPHYEVVGLVTQVIDGDTIDVWIEDIVVDLHPLADVRENTDETVRFGGGIDAPELAEVGGPESGDFVSKLCPLWSRVYLDLDDLAVGGETGLPYRGKHERLIAVVYRVIEGQWVNINAELLKWGMEAYPGNDWDEYAYIESEFDMYEWTPYDNGYPYVRKS